MDKAEGQIILHMTGKEYGKYGAAVHSEVTGLMHQAMKRSKGRLDDLLKHR